MPSILPIRDLGRLVSVDCSRRPLTLTERAAATALVLLLSTNCYSLPPGSGSFFWDDATGASDPDKPLTVYYYRPETVSANTPVWIAMHGSNRNGDVYRDYFVSAAKAQGALVIAPEFSDADWPNSSSYNLGNVSQSESTAQPIEERFWSFSKIEPLFDHVVQTLEPTIEANDYFMFGHSAGSQFTHRYLEWKPDARVRLAVAANAGWYTLAQFNSPDYPHAWPYSLAGVPDLDASTAQYDSFPTAQLENALDRRMVVLLGDQDQERSSSVRQTPEADAQGLNRFERGQFFYSQGELQAAARGVPFGWDLAIVEGVSHNGSQAAIAAAELFRLANLPPGDFDQNSHVDQADYDLWAVSLGSSLTPGTGADANADGLVTAVDYALWRENLTGPPPQQPTYFYVGASGGDFFSESNWNTAPDGSGASAPAGSLAPAAADSSADIELELVIDGQNVVAAGSVRIGEGGRGSLTLFNGADLHVSAAGADLEIDADGAFTLNNSALDVADNFSFAGEVALSGGTVRAGNDFEADPFSELQIDGTSVTIIDNAQFLRFAESSSISNATIATADRFGLDADSVDVRVMDTTIVVDGGTGDLEDLSGALTNDAGTLTLFGSSELRADDLEEGARIVLDDASSAILGGSGSNAYVGDGGSTVTLLSPLASLSVPTVPMGSIDPRDFLINGLTGLTYSQDPSAWNLANWNGASAATLQILDLATTIPEPSTAALLVVLSVSNAVSLRVCW